MYIKMTNTSRMVTDPMFCPQRMDGRNAVYPEHKNEAVKSS